MNWTTKVSVVIPTPEIDSRVYECLERTLRLRYSEHEVILLPDADVGSIPGVRVIPTGEVGPSEKRNLGIEHSTGQVIAFLDSDAYPAEDWLIRSVGYFDDPEVCAVGGPNVTPPGVGLFERACGQTLESFMAALSLRYRHLPREEREVDDLPACNLLVRKADLVRVGGFDERFWPGEDTHLCLKLTKQLGKRILYHPKILVYHHRRKLFLPYVRQIGRYAFMRGRFVKRFPQTSLRPIYFAHSLIALTLCASAISMVLVPNWIGPTLLGLYSVAVVVSSSRLHRPIESILTAIGTVLTTFTYGFLFIAGLVADLGAQES